VRSGLVLVAALLLAACGDRQAGKDGIRQTGLPGVETAGGHTSGQVIAATATAGPVNPGPAGTPGIPLGSEGNTGGAALGSSMPKTTNIAAATNAPAGPAVAPATGASAAASAPLSPASAAALEAQQAQLALERVQDRVAAAWRARAATQGFASAPAAPPAAIVVRSEKLGTAPPSADVKQPTKPATPSVVDPKAPNAASPRP
jgi:hypothetical protein